MASSVAHSFAAYDRINPGFLDDILSGVDNDIEMTMDGEDVNMSNTSTTATNETDRLVIAIDFGTTFSSVAYALVGKGMRGEDLNLGDIFCIGNYPDYVEPPNSADRRFDVPSELWYDSNAKRIQNNSITCEQEQSSDSSKLSDDSSSNDDSSSDEEVEVEMNRDNEQNTMSSRNLRGRSERPRYWGFGVQAQYQRMDVPMDNERRISRFKLLLDPKDETKNVRTDLEPILRNLTKRRIISEKHDVFAHYLTHLLEHTKHELENLSLLQNDTPIEFVLCVPAKWPARGCRVMQKAMQLAVKAAGLGDLANNSVYNLFIVSEPEAAATCVLEEAIDGVRYGETIVILDAGGGTVDAVTYEVTNDVPLRLHAEVVPPDSKLCGASYINESFGKLLMKKLAHEEYLVANGKTIKSIAEAKTVEFENFAKRRIDTTQKKATIPPVAIDYLRERPKHGLFQNRLEINHKEIKKIFEPSLKGAKEVLRGQLEMAKCKEYSVTKVILTGGFGRSPALRSELLQYLQQEKNFAGGEISLVAPMSPSTTVAKGAVLRALNKSDGPARISQCSYGHLLWEPYEPEALPEHKGAKPTISKADGERYIETINWVIQKGEAVPNLQEYPMAVKHTFSLLSKRFICREAVFVSDECHESHYRKTHAKNKGAELAGCIEADMTFLRDEGHIQPEWPSEHSQHFNNRKQHWAVHFELVIIVEGRNLRYEARWPVKAEMAPGQQQQVQARGQICIAAAFQPGTA